MCARCSRGFLLKKSASSPSFTRRRDGWSTKVRGDKTCASVRLFGPMDSSPVEQISLHYIFCVKEARLSYTSFQRGGVESFTSGCVQEPISPIWLTCHRSYIGTADAFSTVLDGSWDAFVDRFWLPILQGLTPSRCLPPRRRHGGREPGFWSHPRMQGVICRSTKVVAGPTNTSYLALKGGIGERAPASPCEGSWTASVATTSFIQRSSTNGALGSAFVAGPP